VTIIFDSTLHSRIFVPRPLFSIVRNCLKRDNFAMIESLLSAEVIHDITLDNIDPRIFMVRLKDKDYPISLMDSSEVGNTGKYIYIYYEKQP
jgi:hypothetical protein